MSQNQFIITINREFGSGGREIAYKMGELLGVKVYDKSILNAIAENFNMTEEEIERVKAQKHNWWDDFCRFYQKFGAAADVREVNKTVTPAAIYHAEAKILRGLAEKESCIILGRSGFHVFKDYPNALKIFLTANIDYRIKRICETEKTDESSAEKLIEKIDSARETYTKNFSGKSRYDVRNYDFVFNVTGVSTDLVAKFLTDNIILKFGQAK